MSVRWWNYLGGGQFFSVDAVLDSSGTNRPPRFTKPTARADRPVSHGAPNLAAHLNGRRALVDRLHRDRVEHRPDSDTPEAA